MKLREIIVDAIKYPISDIRKFLIFCALIILMSLSTVLPSYGVKDSTLSLILTLVTLIVVFIVLGYSMDVIKGGTEGDDTLPDFDYVKNFVMGIKAFILNLIYLIIPLVIVIIIASATGLFSSLTEIVNVGINSLANETTNVTNVTTIIASVPKSTMNTFTNALSITVTAGIILFIIFSFLAFTAQVRFAKTGSGTEGLRFREILRDISKVGFIKIIVTLIVTYIIALAMVFVIGLIGLIPYIGVFIGIFVGMPFVILYLYRSIGLLYADA